ncbi:MAG TPA: hypothetical protein VEC97_02580 [Candidatus Acidoferrales bacterium]|nr:hypothetical protein [Candidatus Acidoferrales bacterium]
MKRMSDECLCKECPICGNRITGANYCCPNCKLCLCFQCGVKIVLAEHGAKPTCPSCGNKMA